MANVYPAAQRAMGFRSRARSDAEVLEKSHKMTIAARREEKRDAL